VKKRVLLAGKTVTSSSLLGIDDSLTDVIEHCVVSPAARMATMVMVGQVIFLCDLPVEFSTRGFLGVTPQKVYN